MQAGNPTPPAAKVAASEEEAAPVTEAIPKPTDGDAAPTNDPPGAAIIGSPVVSIAPGDVESPPELINCHRCQGQCAAGTRFCKYCGASLSEGERGAAPSKAPPQEPVSTPPPAVVASPAPVVPAVPTPASAPAAVAAANLSAAPVVAPAPPPASVKAPSRPPAPSVRRPPVASAPPSARGSAGSASARGGKPPSVKPPPPAVVSLSDADFVDAAATPIPAPSQRPTVETKVPQSTDLPPSQAATRSVRPPTATSFGKLVVIVEDGSEGKSFPLPGNQVDVGRSEGDILLYDDQYVSPRHARLIREENRWHLRDLGSTNGVYIRIRAPKSLKDGDLLLLGLEVLQFQTVSDAERGLGPATQHGTLLFGSPASPRRARLNQRTVEGVTRDIFHLIRDETVIGREVGDIVFTADPFMSRRHAVIRRNRDSGAFNVVDLDSSNGTYVNIREDVALNHGDFVRIGQHLFRLDLS